MIVVCRDACKGGLKLEFHEAPVKGEFPAKTKQRATGLEPATSSLGS